jgi:hypothetical protein
MGTAANATHREPWNKGKIVGQKAPFKLQDIWALRVRLQMENRVRELALFNLGIDSKLRGCDLVQGPRRLPRRPGRLAGCRDAAQEPATRSVRDHASCP